MSSACSAEHAVTYACPICSKALRTQSGQVSHVRWCRGGAAVDAEADNALRGVHVAAREGEADDLVDHYAYKARDVSPCDTNCGHGLP